MNRRKFLEELVRVLAGASSIAPLIGCSNEEKKVKTPSNIIIDGKKYSVSDGMISQEKSISNSLKIGILADTHANSENTRFFANQLLNEKVDAFILAGDLSWSFGDYEGSKDDYNEIVSVVESVAETGKLVLTYPGNHEQRVSYSKALEYLAKVHTNVIDMERIPVADLNGLTIVGLGGNDNAQFNVPEGYLRSKADFDKLSELAKKYQRDIPLLFATHIPMRYSTKNGLDVIEGGKNNVGGIDLATIRKALGSKFGVSGHIHEAYGII